MWWKFTTKVVKIYHKDFFSTTKNAVYDSVEALFWSTPKIALVNKTSTLVSDTFTRQLVPLILGMNPTKDAFPNNHNLYEQIVQLVTPCNRLVSLIWPKMTAFVPFKAH